MIRQTDYPKVAVLMSSYNGEKYIREQLNSILNQKGVQLKLYVRDDGSSDHTVDILKEYKRIGNIVIIEDGERLGPGGSFMQLLYICGKEPFDYFAFSDQDDIWFDDKLRVAIGQLQEYKTELPLLYGSNQYLYIEGENCGFRHKEIQNMSLIGHMTRNTISGCTFVFNKALAVKISEVPHVDKDLIKYRMHDAWLFLVAIVCGKAIYDPNAYMLYRIHGENVVGLKKDDFRDKICKIRNIYNRKIRKKTAVQLLNLYPDMSNSCEKILCKYALYDTSIKKRFSLLFDKDIINHCEENPLSFAFKVILGVI